MHWRGVHMENDKLFEFIEKMYAELKGNQEKMYSEMKAGFKSVNNRLDNVEGRLGNVEKAVISLEYELKETKKTLYDGYVQNTEAINRLETKVDKLSEKVDRHDIKIQVIEGGKKAL
jgi:predicted  nucleic acid-binding Zn-ribbon protein